MPEVSCLGWMFDDDGDLEEEKGFGLSAVDAAASLLSPEGLGFFREGLP